MCRTSTPVISESSESFGPSLPSHLKVDSSTIMKERRTSTALESFRICWAPVERVHRQSTSRYDVQLVGWGGKRYTFQTADEEPSILLPTGVVQEKVGETFTVQIRVLNEWRGRGAWRGRGVGEWSNKSRVLSVTKPSSLTSPQSPTAITSAPTSQESLSKAKGSTKRPRSILDGFISKFCRRTAKASLAQSIGQSMI